MYFARAKPPFVLFPTTSTSRAAADAAGPGPSYSHPSSFTHKEGFLRGHRPPTIDVGPLKGLGKIRLDQSQLLLFKEFFGLDHRLDRVTQLFAIAPRLPQDIGTGASTSFYTHVRKEVRPR